MLASTLAGLGYPLRRQVLISTSRMLTTLDLNGILLVDSSGGPRTISLMDGDSIGAGGFFYISAPAGSANAVTVIFPVGNTYNNGKVGSVTLSADDDSILVVAGQGKTWNVFFGEASGVNAGITSTFVYRPGDPNPGANVFADWAALVATIGNIEGPKVIEVDDTLVAPGPAIIPTGSWDMNDSVLQGRYGSQQTVLRGSVGSQMTNMFVIRQNLQLQNADPALALIELNPLEFFDVRDGASLACIVDYPVVEFSAAGAAVLRLEEATIQNLALGTAVVGATGGAGNSLVIESYDGSVVDDDTLQIAVGSIVTVRMRDFGSNFSRAHSSAVGTLAVGNITASATGVPKYDDLFDSGIVTQRWRTTFSRVALAAAAVGSGTASPSFGANSVGRLSGVGNAIDAASIAQIQIANPAAPEQSAVRAEGVARADIAGSVARLYASGIGASAQGYVRAQTADLGRIYATGIGAFASGYVHAWGYAATILASANGSYAGGYALSYFPAGYGSATVQATERGAWAFGAVSYDGEITASERGARASGWAGGGPFVLGYPGIIRATLPGASAHGHALGGILEGTGNGATAFGVVRTALAGSAPSRISARGDGSLAGGWCFPSGLIEAGYSPTYGPTTFPGGIAWGAATDSDGGAAPATIRTLAHGAVAMGASFGPNALLYSYNVGSFVFGYALSHLPTSYAEIRTLGDQGGCLAGGAASAHQTNTARISAEENGAFAWGVAGDAVNASAYIRAQGEGSVALGHADEGGTIHASGKGSLARGDAESPGGVSTAGVIASGIGATAQGRTLAGIAGSTATITASGDGSTALGLASSLVTGDLNLRATGPGSFASGYVNNRTGAGVDGLIEATWKGSHAMGYADAYYGLAQIRSTNRGSFGMGHVLYEGTIISQGFGSFALGSVIGGLYGGPVGEINANYAGGFAFGYARGGKIESKGGGALAIGGIQSLGTSVGSIYAYERGCFAAGSVATIDTSTGEIRTGNHGAFAMGSVYTANDGIGRVAANDDGAFALGYAQATGVGSTAYITANDDGDMASGIGSGGSIVANAGGARAHGRALSGRLITATGFGALAIGHAGSAVGGADITASGEGSLAQGNADTGAIVASASNAAQFGVGTNAVADSVRIGAAGLHFKGTVGAFGVAANGQFWVDNGNVYCYSGGAIQNLTNVP